MNIQRTFHQRFPAAPIGGVTPIAQKDQALVEDKLDISDFDATEVSRAKKKSLIDFGFQAAQFGVLGAAFGFIAGAGPIGIAIGAGVGLYTAFNKTLRKSMGKVKINQDGEKRTAYFHGKTTNYVKTASEVRAEKLADGVLGEMVGPPPEVKDIPEIQADPKLDAHNDTLKELGNKRKLVADLGGKSRYGYPVLHSVDAKTARAFLGGGKDVYAVSGQSEDKTFRLNTSAEDFAETVMRNRKRAHVERSYDYQLQNLSEDGAFEKLADGEGLPKALQGVYPNHDFITINVGNESQSGMGQTASKRSSTSFNHHRVTLDDRLNLGRKDDAEVRIVPSINVRDPIMLAGVAAGMATGLALVPGIPGATLLGGAIGGVLGREIGLLAQGKVSSSNSRRMQEDERRLADEVNKNFGQYDL